MHIVTKTVDTAICCDRNSRERTERKKGDAKELFLKMISQLARAYGAEEKMIQSVPDYPDDDFPADVELVVVHGADCTKLTFRVPDVWVWACAEDFTDE